jgi:uncharacterized protein involved in exopolysaccharide biosynthesis
MKTVTLVLFLATLPCIAQAPPKYSATVQLYISGEDDTLKTQVNSFLSRELRSLGDITIVDVKPDIVFQVIALRLKSQQGTPPVSGFSIATLITSPETYEFLKVLKDRIGDVLLDALKTRTGGGSYVLDFRLRSGSLDDVKSICQQIVADFDATILDQQRKLWNQLHNQRTK